MDPSFDTSRRSDQEALGAEQPPAVTAAPGHPILRYTIRRLLVGVGLVFVISALLFAATEILPGDPAAAMLGRNATPERVAAVRENLGLNRPPVERYVDWLTGFVQGDLGESFVTRRTVTDAIAPRIGNTLVLAAITLIVGTPIALGLGLWAGIRAGKRTDRAISASGMALGSTPEFVLGTLLIIVLATNLGLLLPVSLIIPGESPLSQLDLLILPILTMVLVGIIPFPARMVRAGVAEAIQSDYVEMARLNGVPERRVRSKYVVRNSLAPTVQVMALTLQWLLGSVIIVEVLFNYPGIGELMAEAVFSRDIPMVQSIALMLALAFIVINVIADVIVIILVPKLRATV